MTDAKLEETKQVAKPVGAEKKNADEKTIAALSVDATRLIEILSKELQGIQQIKPPAWAAFAKTGAGKERPPARKDWWYVRTASVLRTVARLGPVGTSKLRTKYGGKHSRGYKSERFARGSGSIIRKAMQQLEKAGLVKQAVKGVHKGRIITEKASAILRAAAHKAIAEPMKAKATEAHAHSAASTAQSPMAEKKEARKTKKE